MHNDNKISRRKFIEKSVIGTGVVLAGSQLGSIISASSLHKMNENISNEFAFREGTFPFYKFIKEYSFGEFIPKDQGGKFVQMGLLGTEADDKIVKIVSQEFINKYLGLPNDWSVFEKSELEKSVWFNRFYYLPSFARQFYLDKDNSHLTFIMDLLQNWIKENPVSGPTRSKYNWFDMQVAWRSINLSWCYYLGKDGLSNSEKELIYTLQGEHAKILMKDFGKKELNEFNHQSHGALAILYLAILFPSLPESPELLQTGIRIINHHVEKAFYADGGNVEQMFGYYPFITSVFRDAYLLQKSNNVGEPERIFPLLKKMYNYLSIIMQPDKTVPPINDSYAETTEHIILTLKEILGNNDLPIIPNSTFLQDSQVAVIRSTSLEAKPWYIILNAAKLIGSHSHAGSLAINLWYNNKPVLVDSGCCNYDNPLLVDWYRTSEAHNTVIIDGKSDFATSQKNVQWVAKRFTENKIEHFIDNNDYKFCRMVSPESDETNSKVRWTRDVVLLMDQYVVIHDCFETNEEHKYETIFRFANVKINPLDSKSLLIIRPEDKLVFMKINNCDSEESVIKSDYYNDKGKDIKTPTSIFKWNAKETYHSTYLIEAIYNEITTENIQAEQKIIDNTCIVTITEARGNELLLIFSNGKTEREKVFRYEFKRKS